MEKHIEYFGKWVFKIQLFLFVITRYRVVSSYAILFLGEFCMILFIKGIKLEGIENGGKNTFATTMGKLLR